MKMNYSYILHTPEKLIKIDENIALFEEKGGKIYDIAPFSVSKKVTENGIYRIIELTVSSENDAEVYLSLMGEGEAKFFSFQNSPEDERIYRQSPHDVKRYHFKMQRNAVPMVAAVMGEETAFFISDNPSYFDNATTQHIIPAENTFYLSSGDKGGAPNFPESDHFDPIFHKIGGKLSQRRPTSK